MLTLISHTGHQLNISVNGLISLALNYRIEREEVHRITFTDSTGCPFYVVSPEFGGLDCREALKGLYTC